MSVSPIARGILGGCFIFCFYFLDGALRCMGAPVCSFQHIMHGRAGAPSGKIYLVGILNFDLSNLILPRVANFLIQFFNRGIPKIKNFTKSQFFHFVLCVFNS
jgi:hypothetical protein